MISLLFLRSLSFYPFLFSSVAAEAISSLDVIPLLLQEGIAGLLLAALLATALRETLVLADRHVCLHGAFS